MASNSPNILFIFTDQQRADTIGTFNPVMRTPTMNRLCAEGTMFTQAWNAPSFGAALRYLFAPPGWSPDGSTLTSEQLRHQTTGMAQARI